MAGHSKWANIRHRKGAQDAKKGKLFTRIIREISISAKIGGPHLNSNPRLRKAVNDAKSSNMPNQNIERAIKKGAGLLPGMQYEEIIYEGYGPGGVAILLNVVTDNKNRSVAEIRHLFSKFGGKLGGNGSVLWIFKKKGIILVNKESNDEEFIYEISIQNGVDDISQSENNFIIICKVEDLEKIKKSFLASNIKIISSEIDLIPKVIQKVKFNQLDKLNNLLESLSAHDDISYVYSNQKL